MDNIIVRDQSKLKVWVVNITNNFSKNNEETKEISIAKVIIEVLLPG